MRKIIDPKTVEAWGTQVLIEYSYKNFCASTSYFPVVTGGKSGIVSKFYS